MQNEINTTAENFLRQLAGIEREIAKFKNFMNGESNYYGSSLDIDTAAYSLAGRIERRGKSLKAYGSQLEDLTLEDGEKNGAEQDKENLAELLKKFKTALN